MCYIAAYIYIYIYKYMRNIIKHNDDFNERTNTLLYKNISLTLYSRKGWCWLCVRGELETGTDCYILTQFLLTIALLLSHLVGLLNRGSLSAARPSVCSWSQFGILSLTDSNLARTASVTWLYKSLTSTWFRCSSAYLHRCISWLTARSRVNMLQINWNQEINKPFVPEQQSPPVFACVCIQATSPH